MRTLSLISFASLLLCGCSDREASSDKGDRVVGWSSGYATCETTFRVVDEQSEQPIADAKVTFYDQHASLQIRRIERLKGDGREEVPDMPSGRVAMTGAYGEADLSCMFWSCSAILGSDYSEKKRESVKRPGGIYSEGRFLVEASGYISLLIDAEALFPDSPYAEMPSVVTIHLKKEPHRVPVTD